MFPIEITNDIKYCLLETVVFSTGGGMLILFVENVVLLCGIEKIIYQI